MKLRRIWWVVEAFFVCSVKGFIAFVFRKPDKKREEWMGDFFGWDTEEMFDRAGRELWAEQITLPRGSWSHHRTDLLAEWNRSHTERGTKLLCFLGAFLGLTGFIAGFFAAGWF